MNYKPYLSFFFFLIIFILSTLLLVSGCRSRSKALEASSASTLETSLQMAGPNRSELTKVLSFYSSDPTDSLKLKAAIFLIGNMQEKDFYKGKDLDRFYKLCDSISGNTSNPALYKQAFQAFDETNGSLVGQPHKVTDLESMTSQYLIQNIEEAFKSWKEASWKDSISFDNFCEYILPYRLVDEPYENFRSSLYKEYGFSNRNHCDRQAAADSILGKTSRKGMFLFQFPDFVPGLPVSVLRKLKGGSCVESSSLAIYIMRSFGLPVAQDFTPQWPHRSSGHTWAALVIGEDSCIDFEGVNATSIGGHLLANKGNKVAKVFRRTYSRQANSLAMIHGDENIPEIFQDPCIKDVSSSYYKGVTLQVIPDSNRTAGKKFTYLCVFDNANWIPVAWSSAVGGKFAFGGMGRNAVYLPVLYDGGKYQAIGPPMKVDSGGSVTAIVPDTTKKITLHLKRKYPIFDWWDSRTLAMKGGRFQASDNASFTNAVTVYTIREAPEMNYQKIPVISSRRFKYWRYLPVDSSYGDIAEIQFYDQNGVQLKGTPIGSSDCDPSNGIQAAFDNDPLTFFQGLTSKGNWVGMRFDSPSRIATIKYLCRNDDNFINRFDVYELFYWDKEDWHSMGTRTGDSTQVVVFDHVPSNALYLLHDRTRGREDRIFTYEKNKQIWW